MSNDYLQDAHKTQQAKLSKMVGKGHKVWFGPEAAAKNTGQPSGEVVKPPKSVAAPQFVEDRTIPSATPQSWVTGKGESAQGKPGFDGDNPHQLARRK